MTQTTDIGALCAVVDDGDMSALAPLADALEEASDPRAAGLRLATDPARLDWRRRDKGPWQSGPDCFVWHQATVQDLVGWPERQQFLNETFRSRAEAWLALAAATVAPGGAACVTEAE